MKTKFDLTQFEDNSLYLICTISVSRELQNNLESDTCYKRYLDIGIIITIESSHIL